MRSLLAVALIAAAASTASAEGYLGLGVGTSASPTNGDLPDAASDGNRTGRLLGGYRFGHFSVEGAGERYGLYRGKQASQGTVLAVAGKYSLALGNDFEAFGRAGLQRTWLTTDNDGTADLAGTGWLLGAGFEYRFKVAATGASAFVDYEHSQTSLLNQRDMRTTRDSGIGIWMLGVTVSL